jgi:hypothetical protein
MLDELFGHIAESKKKELESLEERKREILQSDLSLKDAFDYFSEKKDFQPGDIIEWVPGLSDRTIPKVGDAILFIKWLSSEEREKFIPEKIESISQQFYNFDCLVLIKHETMGFIPIYLESWRLKRRNP